MDLLEKARLKQLEGKKNIESKPKVNKISLPSKQIKTNNLPPNLSIGDLRSMYRHIFYKDPPHNSEWNKARIKKAIVEHLQKEVN